MVGMHEWKEFILMDIFHILSLLISSSGTFVSIIALMISRKNKNAELEIKINVIEERLNNHTKEVDKLDDKLSQIRDLL